MENLLPHAPGWDITDDATKLEGHFSSKNFRVALDFVSQVGELAETEFYHPILVRFGWCFATIVLQKKK